MAKKVGNRYGRRGVPVDWNAIKTLWCAGKMTSKEIAVMFPPLSHCTIDTRASREGWRELRDQARAYLKMAGDKTKFKGGPSGPATDIPPGANPPAPFVLPIPVDRVYSNRTIPHPDPEKRVPPTVKGKNGKNFIPANTMSDEAILARAIEIQSADTFRTRVIQANEKALKVLETSPPTNVGEVDRFAEALTKVERIGARTYGYDRESDRPVVNIGVLTAGAGSEYD
jgi:hypothetical protein